MSKAPEIQRCAWANFSPLLRKYHDREWGVPVHNDRKLFEFLVLEGMQAGLNWETILRKRESFRTAFARFDPRKVARFTPRAIKRLLADPRIIRNRAKIQAAVTNARQLLQIQREYGSFNRYIWGFVGGRPLIRRSRTLAQVPAQTAVSVAVSNDLRRRGFRFIGPTICYAFMQAVGMVNDHTTSCFRWAELARAKKPR